MSSVKEYLFEVQQENCIKWIRETFGVHVDPDEDGDEWAHYAAEYSAMLDAEAEIQWLNRHSHSQFFVEFETELATATTLLNTSMSSASANTVYKLVYAHTVTLLETLINSVVRKLIVSDEDLLRSLAAGYKKVSGVTVTLKEIAEQPKLVENIVLKILSEQTFQSVSTIKEVLGVMFGDHMRDLDLSGIGRICSKRHDIIHRNGKTVDDKPIELSHAEVGQAIAAIRDFGQDVRRRIEAALQESDPLAFCLPSLCTPTVLLRAVKSMLSARVVVSAGS